jgi:hypothetical protein
MQKASGESRSPTTLWHTWGSGQAHAQTADDEADPAQDELDPDVHGASSDGGQVKDEPSVQVKRLPTPEGDVNDLSLNFVGISPASPDPSDH